MFGFKLRASRELILSLCIKKHLEAQQKFFRLALLTPDWAPIFDLFVEEQRDLGIAYGFRVKTVTYDQGFELAPIKPC